jgi:flagellar biosynthesis/type III secretory pathway chaperone
MNLAGLAEIYTMRKQMQKIVKQKSAALSMLEQAQKEAAHAKQEAEQFHREYNMTLNFNKKLAADIE